MAGRNEIWVYTEHHDGMVSGAAFELMTKAHEVAEAMGGRKVAAVVAGSDNKAAEKAMIEAGADKVYSIENPELSDYRCDVYTSVISELAAYYEPEYFFFGATGIGSELAPSVAGTLKTGLAAHCIDLRWNGERLNCMVPAFGGKVVSEIYIPSARPAMASVRAGILEAKPWEGPRDGEIITVGADIVKTLSEFAGSAEELIDFIPAEKSDNDIESAEVVVSAGRGAASDKAWESVQALADRLDGAVAWSRAFKDMGRVPDESSMIGTSGKSVKAKLLINAGISGASQYVCGINKARTVISINKDANAKIFGHSDYGVVGDAEKILPAILKRL